VIDHKSGRIADDFMKCSQSS